MRNLKLNQMKLMEHIIDGLNETQPGETPWSEQTVCIGVIDGRQLKLVITRDKDDFMERPPKRHFCVTETK